MGGKSLLRMLRPNGQTDRYHQTGSESVKGKGKRCSSLISVEGHFGDLEVKAYILKLVGSKNVKTDENCVF